MGCVHGSTIGRHVLWSFVVQQRPVEVAEYGGKRERARTLFLVLFGKEPSKAFRMDAARLGVREAEAEARPTPTRAPSAGERGNTPGEDMVLRAMDCVPAQRERHTIFKS